MTYLRIRRTLTHLVPSTGGADDFEGPPLLHLNLGGVDLLHIEGLDCPHQQQTVEDNFHSDVRIISGSDPSLVTRQCPLCGAVVICQSETRRKNR